jgi:hypothetical protein
MRANAHVLIMGKTKLSITQLIAKITDVELGSLYDGLNKVDQIQMDNIFKHLVKFKVAFGNARPLRPIEMVCILMLLVVYQQFKKLFHFQYEEMRRMRKAMEAAGLMEEIEVPALEEEDNAEIEAELLKMLELKEKGAPQLP